MKRIGNLFPQLLDINLINFADTYARKGKHNFGIYKHDKHKEEDNLKLLKSFKEGTFTTSKYKTFKIYEPKERIIMALPYRDRIVHQWYVEEFIKPIFVPRLIKDTYACIDSRGAHACYKQTQKYMRRMKNKYGSYYILKGDIKKYFYSINKDILFHILIKTIKDEHLIDLTKKLIYDDGNDKGIPIGNYTSQYFANIYLGELDNYIKKELHIKYY